MSSSPAPDQYARLGGARKLTLVDAVAQSVGFMGPVFSIAFLVPLVMGLNASGSGAGTSAPLSVALAAVGVLGLGWIVAEYARRIQAAGSLYDYVTDGLGQRVGAAAGYLYYLGVLALGAGLLVLIGGTIHDTLAAEFGSGVLPEVGWDVLVLVGLATVLYLGVSLSTRAQLVLALISLATVGLFALYLVIKVGSGNRVLTAITPSPDPQGIRGVLFGVLYGVLLFTGFETAANLGEETEHPQRDIPRAVLFSVLAIAGFYVLVSYAQVAGYHFSLDAMGKNAAAPLFGLAGPGADGGYGSVAVRRMLELVVVLDMIAVLIGVSVAASRGFFSPGPGPPAAVAAGAGQHARDADGRQHDGPRRLRRGDRRDTHLDVAARPATGPALRGDVRLVLDLRQLRPDRDLPADVGGGGARAGRPPEAVGGLPGRDRRRAGHRCRPVRRGLPGRRSDDLRTDRGDRRARPGRGGGVRGARARAG
jgi:hypothetical protein